MTANSHISFHRWLIFFGIILFALYVAHHHGFFVTLLSTDQSYLSSAILIIFVGASLHAGWRAHVLGQETDQALKLASAARNKVPLFTLANDQVMVNGADASTSLAHEHLGFMAEKARHQKQVHAQDLLLDRLENTINRGHESGWFIADLMIRLGLLGTVVGFILMLGSLSSIENVDIHAIQQLLTNMSSGMQTALYTTFTGLSAGILLSFQYQLLDQGADRLLAEIIELSEVHAAQHIGSCIDMALG